MAIFYKAIVPRPVWSSSGWELVSDSCSQAPLVKGMQLWVVSVNASSVHQVTLISRRSRGLTLERGDEAGLNSPSYVFGWLEQASRASVLLAVDKGW